MRTSSLRLVSQTITGSPISPCSFMSEVHVALLICQSLLEDECDGVESSVSGIHMVSMVSALSELQENGPSVFESDVCLTVG